MLMHRAALRYSAMLCLLGTLLCWPAASALAGAPSPPEWGPWSRAALAWFGVDALLLSAGYFLKTRGRSPERALALAPRLGGALFLPYTLFGLAVLALSRPFFREPLATAVAPRVWVSGAPMPWSLVALRAQGIDCVLNLCIEFPDLARTRRAGLPYFRVPLLDGAAPAPAQLRAAVQWAAERYTEGRTLLIHCAQGHGRSATVATALLVHLGLEAGPEAARLRIKSARPSTRVGIAQRDVVARVCREGVQGKPGAGAPQAK